MEKELFLKALQTLFYSWGGDTPPEAYWAANEFLNYFYKVNNIKPVIFFEEPDSLPPNYSNADNYDEVIEKIKQL